MRQLANQPTTKPDQQPVHQPKTTVLGANAIGKKMAFTLLQYPTTEGIPTKWGDAHSPQSREVNTLTLPGYSDKQLKKIG
jgi:hypothetical protein